MKMTQIKWTERKISAKNAVGQIVADRCNTDEEDEKQLTDDIRISFLCKFVSTFQTRKIHFFSF